jgi:hypothetical protein
LSGRTPRVRHCEERSDEAIQLVAKVDCFACARNDGRGTGAPKNAQNRQEVALSVTVFIRYQLDPFKRAMFEEYSKRWLSIIPRCGGDVVGYWMPHEGTNNIAFALISFDNLAAYES